jgi:uncharacterized membrane protein
MLALPFAALYAAVGLARHWHFGSSAYDLGIFDQVVWHLSRFEAPGSTVHGFPNVLGDHFSPVISLFAPLYWVWPAPETLIVAQAVLFAASILPVHRFLELRLQARDARLFAVAYGLFWGLQRAAAFDVHEIAFAPLLIALAILALDRANWRGFLAASGLLCLVKEDLIPLVAALGLLWSLRGAGRRDVIRGVLLFAIACALFVGIVGWIIPSFNEAGQYHVGSAFREALARPAASLARLLVPATKLETLAMWLLPFLFLPLASPYGLLAVPLALERFLSASPNHWGTSFHYSAPLAPILAMAAGDGLARLRPRATTVVAVTCVVLSAILPGRQPFWKVVSPSFYAAPAFADTARRALATIPGEASVVAQAAIVPHLSQRQGIYTLRPDGPGAGVDADYVVAAAGVLSPWPFADAAQVRASVDTYRQRGYRTLFDEEGWVVLRR